MENIELKLEIDPKSPYEKAELAALQAKQAIEALTEQDRRRLIRELCGMEAEEVLYCVLRDYWFM